MIIKRIEQAPPTFLRSDAREIFEQVCRRAGVPLHDPREEARRDLEKLAKAIVGKLEALARMRDKAASGKERTSFWSNPWIEFQIEIAGYGRPQQHGLSCALLPVKGQHLGLDPQARQPAVRMDLSPGFADINPTRLFSLLQVLTLGVVVNPLGSSAMPFFSPEHGALRHTIVDSREGDMERWWQHFQNVLTEPFTIGFVDTIGNQPPDDVEHSLESLPALWFEARGGGGAWSGVLLIQIRPLIWDNIQDRAYYSILAGASVWPTRQCPGDLDSLLWKIPPCAFLEAGREAGESVWKAIAAALSDEKGSDDSLKRKDARNPVKAPQDVRRGQDEVPSRFLLEGETRLDKAASRVVSHLHTLKLPRSLHAIPTWDELKRAEIARLQKEHGAAAWGQHLMRRTRPGGEEIIELSAGAEKALLESRGAKSFRRVITDANGITREYLIKRFVVERDWMEARLSWFGSVWPFIGSNEQENLDPVLTQSAVGAGFRGEQGVLFDDLNADEQKAVNQRLKFMTSIRDAQKIMDHLLRVFGRDGCNPLTVAAWELRNLLGCDNDPRGFERIQGSLKTLQELRFEFSTGGSGGKVVQQAAGAFLGEYRYIAKGAGRHTDGEFKLFLMPSSIGCLEFFADDPAGEDVLAAHIDRRLLASSQHYAFHRKASPTSEQKSWGRGYEKSLLALLGFYERAHNFTSGQGHLLRWIESQLTRVSDAQSIPGRSKTPSPSENPSAYQAAPENRIYTQQFCPLLPAGRAYFGALGHFARNPEQGWKLSPYTSSKTKSNDGGLMGHMGRVLPSGRNTTGRTQVIEDALNDLRKVVEIALDGVAVALVHERQDKHAKSKAQRPVGRWLSLQDAALLPEEVLLHKASWFLFIAPDYPERLRDSLERHAQMRLDSGEIDYLVKVAPDRVTLQRLQAEEQKRLLSLKAQHTQDPQWRQQLKATRLERGLSQAATGKIFGVSQQTYYRWEIGVDPDESGKVKGKRIPDQLLPLLERWIETGEAPERSELAALTTRRSGRAQMENPL